MKLLVVEDEQTIRKGIVSWLSKSGFEITEAIDGEEALDLYSKEKFDLILLDIMMPKINGIDVLNTIRNVKGNQTPIIMLTAKSAEEDIIKCLNIGADDYIVKPFSNRELEARINANIRKHSFAESTVDATTKLFEIDSQKFILTKDGVSVELTRKEMDLLKYLIINEDVYIKKSILLENIWGNLDSTDTRTLDIHISKLRKKLEKIGVENVIMTKRGTGYGFVSKNG